MILKKLIKAVLPPVVFDLKTALIRRKSRYQNDVSSTIPWSSGYAVYKREFLALALADRSLLEFFRNAARLPSKYGYGIDERCVEYPWLFSHLLADAKSILDAGSVLNHELIINNPILNNRNLHIMTLAPEQHCFWQKSISYVYGDLRSIPIRDNYYDSIVCLSTLEHVGCDNTRITAESLYSTSRPDDIELVMQEFRRVLKPGGYLFLSVPFGAYQHFGTFQQFDRALLSRAEVAFGETSSQIETFYRYSEDGWQIAAALECSECEYVEWIAKSWASHQLPDPIPAEHDLAAAARAVACVQLAKL